MFHYEACSLPLLVCFGTLNSLVGLDMLSVATSLTEVPSGVIEFPCFRVNSPERRKAKKPKQHAAQRSSLS